MSANTDRIYSPNLVQSQQVVRSVLGALASAGGDLWHFVQMGAVGAATPSMNRPAGSLPRVLRRRPCLIASRLLRRAPYRGGTHK